MTNLRSGRPYLQPPSMNKPADKESSAPPSNSAENRPMDDNAAPMDSNNDNQTIVHSADKARENTPYPNFATDPQPITGDVSKATWQSHQRSLQTYSEKMFASYQKTKLRGEYFWTEFITSFRPHTIKSWPRPVLSEWRDLIMQRGIYLDCDRSRSPYETVIDILYRDKHISPAQPNPNEKGSDHQHSIEKPETNTDGLNHNLEKNDARSDKELQPPIAIPDRGDDPSSSDDSSDDEKPKEATHEVKEEYTAAQDNISHRHDEGGLGVNGIMKAFIGQDKFSGKYEEDLDAVLNIFETLSRMCDATPEEMRKAMPVMLKGNALRLFSKKAKDCVTYENGAEMLRSWYNSREKQNRLLTEWREMKLSEAMEEKPDESEVAVYRDFIARLMSIQDQLDESYQGDKFLRDQLLASVDIPKVQGSLRDKIPRSSQQLINRVANHLSERPRSAGMTAANIASANLGYERQQSSAMYTLGRQFGGEARKPVKQYGSRGYYRGQRRKKPSWLVGVTGCFVCGREGHRANERHDQEAVKAAIRKLKARKQTVLLSEEDLNFVAQMFENDNETGEENDDIANMGQEMMSEGEEDLEDNINDDGYLAFVAESDLQDLQSDLANSSFSHGRTIDNEKNAMIEAMYTHLTRKPQRCFEGVKIDTGANRSSIMSKDQYNSYCDTFGIRCSVRHPDGRMIRGIGGNQPAIGFVTIQVPFRDLNLTIDVDFMLVSGSIPSLLSLRDVYENGLDISLQRQMITFRDKCQKLDFDNFFLIHNWTPNDVPYSLYTEGELRKIHKVFGHPSVTAASGLIKRALGGNLDTKTRRIIEIISDECHICKRNAQAPRRFKMTVGTDDLSFNHNIQVDTMFLNNRPVIHMVDLATHFCAAGFLKNQSAKEVWKSIQRLWNWVYLGPPDHITVDQGSNYTSKEFRGCIESSGVKLEEAPIENPGSIGTVERYHAPLRAAFNKLRADLDSSISDTDCLQAAVHAVNATVGPEGLCPILLVYGALPRPIRANSTQSQIDRARAIDAATKEVEKEQSRRRISFGLRHNGSPKANEDNNMLRELPAGSPVYLYRTRTKLWEGPHIFVSIDGETVIVQTPAGRKIFRSNCIRPVRKPEWPKKETGIVGHAHEKGQTRSSKKLEASKEFASSRSKELNGLLSNGTFEPTPRDQVPEGTRIFGSRFIDQLKKIEDGRIKKSRLVAQNYSDAKATEISTKAPTIQRSSQRLLLSIAASLKNTRPFTRDVTQAYLQSETNLERDVYISAPEEMNLPPGTVLKVVKPLYGVPESGLHWYLTYLHHHTERLKMTRSTVDPCLFFRHANGQLDGAVIIQVDDSLCLGSDEFNTEENDAATTFKTKPRRFLDEKETTFNGINIKRKNDGTIITTQEDKIEAMTDPIDEKSFISVRASAQYIGVNTRPDACANVQLLAPGTEEITKTEFKTLKRTLDHLRETKEDGLTFCPLDMETMRMVLISDASFANARGGKSQLGYIVAMVDGTGRANIIHFASNRCRRVTRSVMASEIHALVIGFDNAFALNHLAQEVLNRKIILDAYVDSRTLFDVIARDGRTSEKRLQIDIHALRQSYSQGELQQLGWIPSELNPADALSKTIVKPTETPLWKLMRTNNLELDPIGWSTKQSNEKKNC